MSGGQVSDGTPTCERTVVVCADDYGLSRGIGDGIRSLVSAGRLSAVSCVAAAPAWHIESTLLRPLADRVELGLHLALTNFAPLGALPELASDGRLPSPARIGMLALSGRLDRNEISVEIHRQIDRFVEGIGRLPDFIDGHHHVHLLPIVRDAVVDIVEARLGTVGAWVRRGPAPSDVLAHFGLAIPGAATLCVLGRGLKARAEARGIAGNPALRGVRRFFGDPPYARLFDRFLEGLPSGGLIFCHPGVATTESLPTRHPSWAREQEFAFLMSNAFPAVLQRRACRLGTVRRSQHAGSPRAALVDRVDAAV